MKIILVYLLQMTITSGLLYGYYHFALRNSRFHQYNRFYLIISTVLSLIIPLLRIDIYFTSQQDIPVVYQLLAEVRAGNNNSPVNASAFNRAEIVQLFYCLIAGLLFLRLLIAFMQIVRLKRNYPVEKLQDILFINTQQSGTPFSFFRWLFWNDKINVESAGGQTIFRHELFHIQQKHSWDIVYLELLTMLFWINPFLHLIKKETKAIHEFLADRFAAGGYNKWEYAELLVMQTLQTRQRLVNPFFHNQIKRRIAMITNSSKSSYQYLRKVMVLPIICILVTIIAVNCTAKKVKGEMQDNSKEKTENLGRKLTELKSDLKKGINSKVDSEVIHLIEQMKKDLIVQSEDKIFSKGEVAPSFVGGRTGWAAFLQKNLNPVVPVDKGAPEGKYIVMTQFVVDKTGKISDLKAITHFGYGMEEEVLRVMKLSPAWSPAKQAGQPVKAYTKQPVTFEIISE